MRLFLALELALVGFLVSGVTRPSVTPERGAPVADSLSASVEAALERGDVQTAVRTTEAVYRRAARDHKWESLIEVGDAYYRIAGRTGAPSTASQKANDTYRAALSSARRAASLDGVLRAAEGFAQLGDKDQVDLSLQVARALAGSDAEALDDVRAAAARLSDLSK